MIDFQQEYKMESYNVYLYMAWVLSIAPMAIIAFYGLIRCNVHLIDFIIMLIVGVLPVINTLILFMFVLFECSDWFKKNHSNQH